MSETGTNADPAVELTVEGLQRLLLQGPAHDMTYDVRLRAYEAAPESLRMTNVWAPTIAAELTSVGIDAKDFEFKTPLAAFVTATYTRPWVPDAAIERLFRVLQRAGLFAATDRRAMAKALYRACDRIPRAFALLIAEPSADAALSGPTRCNAGDAHNSPRHHSVRLADEHETVHDVLCLAVRSGAVVSRPTAWRAFSDARLPFGARAMAEEWAYELTGPCGCPGDQRILNYLNALHEAIDCGNDEAGEWLATRLPPKRLNEREERFETTPLIAALRSDDPLPRTVAALLLRVPDVDLTQRASEYWYGGNWESTAAELLTTQDAPKWLPSHLAAELQLKTQQFGEQYLPSAATLCTEQLFVYVGVPRELVNLVLQYTALPQRNPWLTAQR